MTDSTSIFPKKIVVLLVLLVTLILLLPAAGLTFGDPSTAVTDQYYIQNSQVATGANNVVSAIVFDFRGFDTLGEACVLFVAVLGVAMLFRRVRK